MSVLPKELLREIIKENNFQTSQEIMKFLKDSFKDILSRNAGGRNGRRDTIIGTRY
ncbi:hypothetical protein KVG29_00500 [Caldicoprobacter algeriensis]|nr:hypothetical protein [Caldicoprobacter algeriensis]MCM8899703.1 hypothetical protein [Caldicoprobacter algeriensis]